MNNVSAFYVPAASRIIYAENRKHAAQYASKNLGTAKVLPIQATGTVQTEKYNTGTILDVIG
jgi:hypothetical protein